MADEIGLEGTIRLDTGSLEQDLARAEAQFSAFAGHVNRSATATSRLDTGMEGIGNSTKTAGLHLQKFAQTFDDLQYVGEQGMRPILNNIVQISPLLGIAAIAADLLYRNMDRFASAASYTPTAVEEMKELGKQTRLTADEQERLNTLKGQEKGKQENLGGASEAEKKVMASVGKAIDEADQGAIKGAIQGIRKAAGIEGRMTADDIAELEHARKLDARRAIAPDPLGIGGLIPETFEQQKRKEIEDRIKAFDNEAVDNMLGKARGVAGPEGEGARKALLDMAEANPDAFPRGFARDLRDADPAERERQAAETRRLTIEGEAGSAAAEAARTNTRDVNAQTDEMLKHHLATVQGDRERVFRDQDAAARAGDQATQDAFGRVAELKKENDAREELNKEKNKGLEDLARLDERGSDLNWRLRGLMNPTREGQTLGGEAYANTFHSMTGDSPEVKRLHAIEEVLKEIRENEKARKVIAVKAR